MNIFLILLALLATSTSAVRRQKRIFLLSFFYDDTYDNVPDLTAYSADIIARHLQRSDFRFEYTINRVYSNSSFKLTKLLCNELFDGRLAVIGVGTSPVFAHIKAITNSLRIPYIAIEWTEKSMDNEHISEQEAPSIDQLTNIVNVHPPAHQLMRAYIDLILHYQWEFITILYSEARGPDRVQDLIKLPYSDIKAKSLKKMRLQIRQLSADTSQWIYQLKEIKLSGSSHLIIDIERSLFNEFIKVGEEVGLLTPYFHLMFVTLDLQAFEFSPAANVTTLQLNDLNNTKTTTINAEFNLKNMVANKPLFKHLPCQAAFIYDAMLLLATTVNLNGLADKIVSSPSVSCANESPWAFGDEMVRLIKLNDFYGLSGRVKFEAATGDRQNFSLRIMDMAKDGLSLYGYWTTDMGNHSVQVTRSTETTKNQVDGKLNRHLIVVTKLEAPYVIEKQPVNNQSYVGNEKYRGFCVEMLEKIARICNFTYTIKIVDDGFHGAFVNGKWNGMIAELIEKKVDLSVAALSISFQREQVIDFTDPFLNLGISILYKRPEKKAPELFSFLSPLSIELWIYMSASFIIVAFMLFIVARFSPYEWQSPHPCNPGSNLLENQFTMVNCIWYTLASLMHQGTEIAPKAASVRVISIAWAFFTLIIISSYTANFTAFLTVKRMQSPINNAEDLSKQTDIKYGAVNGGSTQNFFKESIIQTYERMWNFMSSNPSVFVKSSKEGISRVKAGGYAYLIESVTNEYMRQRDCDLIQIGGLLDSKGYGIGTPTGSPWRDKVSNAILRLQENGDIQELYTKWWMREDMPDIFCDNDDKKDSNQLYIENVIGVFIVVAFGLLIALIVAIIEFTWKSKLTSHKQVPFTSRFKNSFTSVLQSFFRSEFKNIFPKVNVHRQREREQTIAHSALETTDAFHLRTKAEGTARKSDLKDIYNTQVAWD